MMKRGQTDMLFVVPFLMIAANIILTGMLILTMITDYIQTSTLATPLLQPMVDLPSNMNSMLIFFTISVFTIPSISAWFVRGNKIFLPVSIGTWLMSIVESVIVSNQIGFLIQVPIFANVVVQLEQWLVVMNLIPFLTTGFGLLTMWFFYGKRDAPRTEFDILRERMLRGRR